MSAPAADGEAAPLQPVRRRFLAPEAIQTSAMDCGPACLKSVLEGFRIPVSYGRLREACHTSIDGTSVASLEAVLTQFGLNASESVVPPEHLFLKQAALLPVIAVTTTPAGLLHFITIWRQIGPYVQVMDPLRGRYWSTAADLLKRLAMVDVPVPLDAFEDFISDDSFQEIVTSRLEALGVANAAGRVQAAVQEGWSSFVRLEGALRFAERLRGHAQFSRAATAGVVEALWTSARTDSEAIPAALQLAAPSPQSVQPGDGEARPAPMVNMRGAVVVAIEGFKPPLAATAVADLKGSEDPVNEMVAQAVGHPEEAPRHVLQKLGRSFGRLPLGLLAMALTASALGALLETLLFRAFFDLGRRLPLLSERVVALAVVAGFSAALLLVEWPTWLKVAKLGRHLEGGLRRAFLDKIPRLQDAYFQSRPVSDMATRAHQIHHIRALPFYAAHIFRVVCELLVTTAGVIWLHPQGTGLALMLLAVLLLVPLLFQAGHEERDMQVRAQAGALSVFYLDALLGLQAVRAHAAEGALQREHAGRLQDWARAAWQAARFGVRAEAVSSLIGYALTAWLLFDHLLRAQGSGWALLLVYWTLSLPALGQEYAFLLQQIPRQKNLVARLVEPLTAAEVSVSAPFMESFVSQAGVAVGFENVVVRVGGHDVLALDELTLHAGSHVALVGASGSGKSSLLGLVLGWHEAAQGRVTLDGQALTAATREALRERTVWVDPAVALWNQSLLENLRYGSARADGPVGSAIEDAELDEVLARLPTGLESSLGEGGGLLSGGEGQRVRFGRSICKSDVRLVVLDEAFRGLERPRRQRLLERARQRWPQATFLCATHDVHDALSFDRVLVLAAGRVVEEGDPRSLADRAASVFSEFLRLEGDVSQRLEGQVWRRWHLGNGQVHETRSADGGTSARAGVA